MSLDRYNSSKWSARRFSLPLVWSSLMSICSQEAVVLLKSIARLLRRLRPCHPLQLQFPVRRAARRRRQSVWMMAEIVLPPLPQHLARQDRPSRTSRLAP